MGQDVEVRCTCGEIHGWIRAVSPKSVSRVLCYCADCQAFLHHLNRADIMDAQGGTEIVQFAPQNVTFDRGAERIAGLRLSPKGPYRWYASCCKTPLGNTLQPNVPFVGIPVEALYGAPDAQSRDALFGKRTAIWGQYAIGKALEASPKMPFGLLGRTAWLILGWKLSGRSWPSPFFDAATKAPSHPVTILSKTERDALRPKCGPNPTGA